MPDFTEKCHIFQVVAKRSHIACDCADFTDVTLYLEARHPEVITVADIEELVFRASREARLAGRGKVHPEDFHRVIDDFLPPHQTEVLRHRERLAFPYVTYFLNLLPGRFRGNEDVLPGQFLEFPPRHPLSYQRSFSHGHNER